MKPSPPRFFRVLLLLLALPFGFVLGTQLFHGANDTQELSKWTTFPGRPKEFPDPPLVALHPHPGDAEQATRVPVFTDPTPVDASESPPVIPDSARRVFSLRVDVRFKDSFAPAGGYEIRTVAESPDGDPVHRAQGVTTPDGTVEFEIPRNAHSLIVDAVFPPSRQRVCRWVETRLSGDDVAIQLLVPEPFRVSVQLRPSPRLSTLAPGDLTVAWDGLQGPGLPPQGLGLGTPDRGFLATQIVHGYAWVDVFRVTVGARDHVVAVGEFTREELTACLPPELAISYHVLRIRVVDRSGKAISSARVYGLSPAPLGLGGYRADDSTDASGCAELNVASTRVDVCIGKEGYQAFQGTLDVRQEEHVIALEEIDYEASVTVDVIDARGQAVPDAVVTLFPGEVPPTVGMAGYVQARTDDRGFARLPIVKEGACYLQAFHSHHGSSSRGVIDAQDDAHAVIQLEDVCEVHLHLFLDGSPWVRNSEPLLWQVDDLDLQRSWSGSFMAGRTLLDELPTGRLAVHLLAPGAGLYSTVQIVADRAGEYDVDVPMNPAARLVGKLPEGFEPSLVTRVIVVANGRSAVQPGWFQAVLSDDGSFSLFVPMDGNVMLDVEGSDHGVERIRLEDVLRNE